MEATVKVVEKETQQLLFECPIDQQEKAYQYAGQMEEMGLDVEIQAPTIHETLSSSLGQDEESVQQLKQSIQEELEDHDSSCCVGPGIVIN
jgi:hypothetical protein